MLQWNYLHTFRNIASTSFQFNITNLSETWLSKHNWDDISTLQVIDDISLLKSFSSILHLKETYVLIINNEKKNDICALIIAIHNFFVVMICQFDMFDYLIKKNNEPLKFKTQSIIVLNCRRSPRLLCQPSIEQRISEVRPELFLN